MTPAFKPCGMSWMISRPKPWFFRSLFSPSVPRRTVKTRTVSLQGFTSPCISHVKSSISRKSTYLLHSIANKKSPKQCVLFLANPYTFLSKQKRLMAAVVRGHVSREVDESTRPGAPGLDSETGDSTPSIRHKSQKNEFMRSATWPLAASLLTRHSVSIPCPILSLFSGERVGSHKSRKNEFIRSATNRVPPVSILRPGIAHLQSASLQQIGTSSQAAQFLAGHGTSRDARTTKWHDFAAETVQIALKSPLVTTLGSHQWNQDFTGKHGFQEGE